MSKINEKHNEHFNVGIIGAGRFAQSVMIPAIQSNKNFKMRAIYSRKLERASKIADAIGSDARAYNDIDEMLADDGIDVVYIASPPHTHSEYVSAATRAGKMIICEKPLARTFKQAEQIVNIVRKTNTTLVVNYSVTNHPAQQKITALVNDGLIGTPIKGRVNFGFYFDPDEWDWRVETYTGGGPMMDLGIHCVNFLRNIFGSAVEVSSMQGRKAFADMESADSIASLITYKDGATAVVESSFAYSANIVEIYGTEGSLIGVDTFGVKLGGEIIHFDRMGKQDAFTVEQRDLFANALDYFGEIFRKAEGYEDKLVGPAGALEDLSVVLCALDEIDVNFLRENKKL